MYDSGHLKQAEALKNSSDDFLKLFAAFALQDLAHPHILLNFINPLSLEKLALRLKQNFGQGLTTELKDEPEVILIFDHVHNFAK